MTKDKKLCALNIEETAIIKKLTCLGCTKRRFLDLGIVSGTKITALYKSPFGNPTAYFIRGTVIALRREDCENILIY
jgi:ferrous iron transport protein A